MIDIDGLLNLAHKALWLLNGYLSTTYYLELKFEPLRQQRSAISAHIIGNWFGYVVAVNARVSGVLIGSLAMNRC